MTGLASHLTDRDRYLCDLLAEHRVLTTNQITTVAFDSPISARHRLATLHRLRVLDRFRPFRPVGSAPQHYVLDALGAMVVAAERGLEEHELSWRRDRAARPRHEPPARSPRRGERVLLRASRRGTR